jgi:hypothetical protein
MNRNKLPDTELDGAIEREIQELLAVEPSSEFVPAMRRRLANEPAPSEWRFGRTFMLAGAMTAVIVAAVVFSRPGPALLDQPQSAGAVSSAVPAPIHAAVTQAQTAVSAPVAETSHPTARRHPRNPIMALNKSAEPEVLVSPGEAAALRRLFTDISAGRVELSAADLPTTTEEVSELTGIHPLIPITIQEGVLQ